LKGLSLISCISVLASCYLILVTFLMSNTERRLKNVEVGIRLGYEFYSESILVHCTWYFVQSSTCYFFNVEH